MRDGFEAATHHVDGSRFGGGGTFKIALGEKSVTQGFEAEFKTVAFKTRAADHFFIGPQKVILVVVGNNFPIFILNPGQMTGGTTHSRTRREFSGLFFHPESVVF